MTSSPSFRETCLSGSVQIGTFAAIPHPAAVEVTAIGGPDFICLDGEHSQIGRADWENLFRAGEVHGVPVMARVPGKAPEVIASALDAGAKGIMVPMVSSAEEARAVVSASRYPPLGRRGVGPGRAAGYGYSIPDYLAAANSAVLVAIQVENVEGLNDIDAIAAVEGIDVIFVGPGDLGVALSALDDPAKPSLEEAVAAIAAACKAHSRVCGIFRPGPADIARRVAEGFRFFIMASDAMVLTAGMSEAMAAARASLKAAEAPANQS